MLGEIVLCYQTDGEKWYFISELIFIFLTTYEVEHFGFCFSLWDLKTIIFSYVNVCLWVNVWTQEQVPLKAKGVRSSLDLE